jgi:predicted transcriptional regulator
MTTDRPVVTAARHLLARDVMSSRPVSVGPDASIWSTWSVMMNTGLGHLIVVVDGRVIGVVDDRNVLAEWPMGPLAVRRRHARELMRSSIACVLPDTDVRTVAALMIRDAIEVPVVAEDGAALGVVTGSDLAVAVVEHGLGDG